MEDNVSVEAIDSGADISMDDHAVADTSMDLGNEERSLEDFLVDSDEDDIDTTEVMGDTSEEVTPEATETPEAPEVASVADEINPANIEEITQERIDQYFKSDDVYKALHENFLASDPEYKTGCILLEDSNALQQYLNQNNPTFANTQDVNLKASILHQAQALLSQRIDSTLVNNAQSYKAQASDYIAAQQLDKYLNDNAANLNGVSKLTGDLYNTIVAKAGLPSDDKTKVEVSSALNNVFLGLSRQFNIHPAELIKVIESFGSKQEVKTALNNLQNTSKLKVVAKERAKSITKGGATNVNSKHNEFENILGKYAI